MRHRVGDALRNAYAEAEGIAILVGYPEYADDRIYNSAAWLQDGAAARQLPQVALPNYGVFDEQRYFTAGTEPLVVDLKGLPIGVSICEDIWDSEAATAASVGAGARLVVSLNGSPFDSNKQQTREALLARRATDNDVAFVYQNLVGGQDELVFDGGSCVVSRTGSVAMRAPGVYRRPVLRRYRACRVGRCPSRCRCGRAASR